MKRSGPLRRITPLKRSGPINRLWAMTHRSEPHRRSDSKPRTSGVPSDVRKQVMMRDGGCVAVRLVPEVLCWGTCDPHHVQRRSQGGEDTPENLVTLCRAHHDWVHANPLRSMSLGLLKRSWE